MMASIAAWLTFFGIIWLTGLVQSLLAASSAPPVRSMTFFDGALFAFAFGGPIVLGICLIVGIPALVLVESFNLTRWWQWAMTGVIAGLLVVLGLLLGFDVPLNTAQIPGAFAFMLTGAAAGVAAWASTWLDRNAPRRLRGAEVE